MPFQKLAPAPGGRHVDDHHVCLSTGPRAWQTLLAKSSTRPRDPRLLSQVEPYDVVSTIFPALHVMKRTLNRRFLSQMASYNVVSNICPALRGGLAHV